MDEFSYMQKDYILGNGINRQLQLFNGVKTKPKIKISEINALDEQMMITKTLSNKLNWKPHHEELQLLENDPFIKMSQAKSPFVTVLGNHILNMNNELNLVPIEQTKSRHSSFNSEYDNGDNFNSTTNLKQSPVQRQIFSPPRKKSHFVIDPRRKETFEYGGSKEITQKKLGLCTCRNVLICDDENFNISALKFLFCKYKILVDECNNGKEGIDKILEKNKNICPICKTDTYKLLLLDILMPVMDGVETAKKIQELINQKLLPDKINIVIVSAHIDNELKLTLQNIKYIKEFVMKPVKGEKIKSIIEKYYFTNQEGSEH